MKGINAMIGVLIMLLIAMTIFAWISTDEAIGEGQKDEIERTTLLSEADRRLQKTELLMQSMFSMSAQKGSAEAAEMSGRAGRDPEDRYWLCKGQEQVPSKGEASYAVSNFTQEITEDRLSEVRGVRRNWFYDVGNISCVETGYNSPLDSTENDYFSSSAKFERVITQDRTRGVSRADVNLSFREQVKYNRYWYLYSTLRHWIEDGTGFKTEIKDELDDLKTGATAKTRACVPDTTTADSVCSGEDTGYDPSGTYPSPSTCREVVGNAEKAVKRGINDELANLEENRFNGSVSCSAEFNEDENGLDFPGIIVTLEYNNDTEATGDMCAETPDDPDEVQCRGKSQAACDSAEYCSWKQFGSEFRCVKDYVEGEIYNCITNWRHKFTVKADFKVTCRDKKFSNVPEDESLNKMEWNTSISLTTEEAGKWDSAPSCSGGGSIPPFELNECTADLTENHCSTEMNLNGRLE